MALLFNLVAPAVGTALVISLGHEFITAPAAFWERMWSEYNEPSPLGAWNDGDYQEEFVIGIGVCVIMAIYAPVMIVMRIINRIRGHSASDPVDRRGFWLLVVAEVVGLSLGFLSIRT
jgi:hypothetical protein